MAIPLFKDEIAFTDGAAGHNPFAATQTWTDVTNLVTSRSVRRGRQTEDDTAMTGAGNFLLNDDDRRFDPENTIGLYAGGVLPMRPLRSRWSQDGGSNWYPFFYTYVDIQNGWQRDDSEPGPVAVTVPGNDAMDVIANANLGAAQTFPQQLSGTRIQAVLNAIGFPAGLQAIDAGQETILAVAAGGATGSALSLIRDAELADSGYFFVDNAGVATFQDRHHRLIAPFTTSQATFVDKANYTGGALQYESVKTRQSLVFNDIQVTAGAGVLQEVQNAASILLYGLRTLQKSTKQTSDGNALLLANWLLGLKAVSYVRYEELLIQPGTDTALWTQVLTRAIGDRIKVKRTPFGGTEVETVDCMIEGISIDVGPGVAATCTWRLSPALSTAGWVLGDAVNGLLGQTTKLVY